MSPDVVDHLREYLGDRDAGPLFPGRGGRAVSVRRAAALRGLAACRENRPVTVHGLRRALRPGSTGPPATCR